MRSRFIFKVRHWAICNTLSLRFLIALGYAVMLFSMPASYGIQLFGLELPTMRAIGRTALAIMYGNAFLYLFIYLTRSKQ